MYTPLLQPLLLLFLSHFGYMSKHFGASSLEKRGVQNITKPL